MDLWTAIKIVLQRWYVVLPVLLLGGAGVLAIDSRLEPTYQATGSMVLVQQSDAPLPYGNMRTTAEVLARVLSEDSTRLNIAARGGTGGYGVEAEREFPIITVIAEGSTPREAIDTVAGVLLEGSVQMNSLQERQQRVVPQADRVLVDAVAAPQNPIALNRARTRALVGIGALTLIAAVTAALGVEALVRDPAERASRRKPAPGSQWPPPGYLATGEGSPPDAGRGAGG